MGGGRIEIGTRSVRQTRELGRRLGEACRGGEVLALTGELGSGKTQLAKGLAAGLGVERPDELTSPTFVLANEYPGRLTFFHIDAYRLADADDLDALGVEEMSGPGSVVAIEWADRVAAWLPPEALSVRLDITGSQSRRVTLCWTGPPAGRLVEAVRGIAFSV